MAAKRLLLFDADVLIDYVQTRRSVLRRARGLAEIFVVTPVLVEVEGLDEAGCQRLGINTIEPTLQQMREAAATHGPLSFADQLCLSVAQSGGYTCVTNDKALRGACTAVGVTVIWGLEIMAKLVRVGLLDYEEACLVARQISEINPFVTPAIVQRFIQKIGDYE